MAAKRSRIDRRLIRHPADACVVVFYDAWGSISKRYDFKTLALPVDVAALLNAAFAAHHAASQADTRRQCWGALRLFARFASQDGRICSAADLTTSMVGRYKSWLDAQKTQFGESWTASSRANKISALRQLIEWTKRHHPQRLPARIDFPHNPYPHRVPQARRRLATHQLKAILRACYEEIDDAWARFRTGQTILASSGPVEGIDPELCRCVRMMARAAGGVTPSMQEMKAQGFAAAMLDRQGGLRAVASHLHLTLEKLTAFFIAIAIQTAGNPDSLRQLRRDCQVPHPLDEHRIMIDWAKLRAGVKIKRAQRRSFDRRRKYAAPNLIEWALAMTEPLRAHARPQDRDRLFLIKSEKKNEVTEVSMSTLGKSVKRFVVRANARIAIWNQAAPERQREQLPDFATAFVRGSVATEHYKSSGGDILEVQEILNHANVHTSDTYVRGPDVQRVQTETIARLQRLMIAWVTGTNVEDAKMQAPIGEPAAVPFGHDCLNPFAGIAAGSEPGRLCPRFGGCFRCPGLVIPLDAAHLARILQAKAAFEDARLRLDPQRWTLLYAPSYRILVNEVLPDFAGALYEEAQSLIFGLPQLPVLE
jgi:site-specific recombinase XerD